MIRDASGLILGALEYAAKRHRTQFRKGEDGTPYINHPIQVANLLVNEGGENDPELLTAAVLHDVIEDTVNSPEEKKALINDIRERFGEGVTRIALEVTDDKELPKEERKRLQIVNAPLISVKARKLRIADKIMNVHDISIHRPAGWTTQRAIDYFDWAEKVVNGMRGVNTALERRFDSELRKAREITKS